MNFPEFEFPGRYQLDEARFRGGSEEAKR